MIVLRKTHVNDALFIVHVVHEVVALVEALTTSVTDVRLSVPAGTRFTHGYLGSEWVNILFHILRREPAREVVTAGICLACKPNRTTEGFVFTSDRLSYVAVVRGQRTCCDSSAGECIYIPSMSCQMPSYGDVSRSVTGRGRIGGWREDEIIVPL